MSKRHVVAAALLIGIGAALGTYAVTRTSDLGVSARASSKKANDATVTVQTRRLNALEASLRKALAQKPPALPRIPKLQPAPQSSRVVYSAAPAPASRSAVRSAAPATSTRTTAAPARGDEQDHEQESGSEDERDD
jgi:hypothetical protein